VCFVVIDELIHNCYDIKVEKDAMFVENVITSEDSVEKLGRLVSELVLITRSE